MFSATTKLGVEGQLVASSINNSKTFEVLRVDGSSDEEVENKEGPKFEIYEGSSDDDDVVYVEQRSIADGGINKGRFRCARSEPGEIEVGKVEQTEKLSVMTDMASSDERDVVFEEHISNANVCNNSTHRETSAAKLRRDMQGEKEAGKVLGRQRGRLPVAVCKTEKRLEVEQWQAWITLQQQVRDNT